MHNSSDLKHETELCCLKIAFGGGGATLSLCLLVETEHPLQAVSQLFGDFCIRVLGDGVLLKLGARTPRKNLLWPAVKTPPHVLSPNRVCHVRISLYYVAILKARDNHLARLAMSSDLQVLKLASRTRRREYLHRLVSWYCILEGLSERTSTV